MRVHWYGWRTTFDMRWGWHSTVRWFVLGPVVISKARVGS